MNESITSTILQVLERAPQWLRHDLQGKDAVARTRAEETLATMIATALAEQPAQDQATYHQLREELPRGISTLGHKPPVSQAFQFRTNGLS
ncbi:DUF6771 family protein [Sphingobium sp. 15-1]|uniref:DUF6771 family protein n=1 Tax=Sphingobium sp. 15-1 TaxID=2729616 RepID=UPI00159C2D37|nr:DUF6771 family protein [Sphingobium sp. 15-1]